MKLSKEERLKRRVLSSKKWQEKNKEKVKEYREKNRERINAYSREWKQRRKLGIIKDKKCSRCEILLKDNEKNLCDYCLKRVIPN